MRITEDGQKLTITESPWLVWLLASMFILGVLFVTTSNFYQTGEIRLWVVAAMLGAAAMGSLVILGNVRMTTVLDKSNDTVTTIRKPIVGVQDRLVVPLSTLLGPVIEEKIDIENDQVYQVQLLCKNGLKLAISRQYSVRANICQRDAQAISDFLKKG